MSWMSLVNELREGASAPVFVRLLRTEGASDWYSVGEVRRSGDSVAVVFEERCAMWAPAWATVPANDNAEHEAGRMALQFAARNCQGQWVSLGERALAGQVLRRTLAAMDAQKATRRRGLRGSAHRTVATSWPDASRCPPEREQRKPQQADGLKRDA